jgi:hypothetical protein
MAINLPYLVSFDLRQNLLYTVRGQNYGGKAMNYEFSKENISQHVVKYGVDVRPAISIGDDKAKLQDYCNRLIGQSPQAFETIVSGPSHLRVQKTFALAGNKRIELPTFLLTARGPVFTFPQRMFINEVQDIDIPEKDKIFRKALDELRNTFADKKVPRVGVINELVFDTGEINSVRILASNLKNDIWREKLRNLTITLQAPTQNKNVNLQIRPTHAKKTGKEVVEYGGDVRFGLIVNVDINNLKITDNLTTAEVNDILAFASDYVPDELIKFLNNEY